VAVATDEVQCQLSACEALSSGLRPVSSRSESVPKLPPLQCCWRLPNDGGTGRGLHTGTISQIATCPLFFLGSAAFRVYPSDSSLKFHRRWR